MRNPTLSTTALLVATILSGAMLTDSLAQS